ncbi:MAG: J domain-containing protein [Bacteroidales bacterium]
MTAADYYKVLGLSEGCSLNDLKRAYRTKARQYHPDLNRHPSAPDLFIRVSEAYEFLHNALSGAFQNDRSYNEKIKQWEEYHRQRARARAEYYSRTRYENFTRSSTYKTTRIFDGTLIIYGMVVSLLIIGIDIYSYTWLKANATTPDEKPSVTFMILLLIMGLVFFAFSYMNLLIFVHNSRKRKKRNDP